MFNFNVDKKLKRWKNCDIISNMKNIFTKYGFNLTEKQLSQFEKYYNLLIDFNAKFNLTAITEKEEVYIKHFVDSIMAVKMLNCGKLIDVGSGGGFPAIPIKIMCENLSVTMLEATGKKCEFLKTVAKELGLEKVEVINGRAEEFAFKENFREKFDYCTARAVARLNILSEYCLPFVKKGGKFVALKGDAKEELLEGLSAIKILGGKLIKENEFTLEGAKRNIIEIEKIALTDKKYPRSNGKIRKNPLWTKF